MASGRTRTLTARRRRLHQHAMEHEPVWLNHADARWDWLQALAASRFSPTARLLGHTLCLHGTADGRRIFPSTRTISEESGLSERSTCTGLEILACGGFLWPDFMEKRTGREWARTYYKLTLPRAIWDGVGSKPWEEDPTWQRTEPASVPSSANGRGTEPDARGTEPGAEGTERHDKKALKDVQSSLSSESLNVVTQRECAAHAAPTFVKRSRNTEPNQDEIERRRREAAELVARLQANGTGKV